MGGIPFSFGSFTKEREGRVGVLVFSSWGRENSNIYIQMCIFVLVGGCNGIKKHYIEGKFRIIRQI